MILILSPTQSKIGLKKSVIFCHTFCRNALNSSSIGCTTSLNHFLISSTNPSKAVFISSNNKLANSVIELTIPKTGLIKTIRYNSVNNNMYFVIDDECFNIDCGSNTLIGGSILLPEASSEPWLEFKPTTNKLYYSSFDANNITILDPLTSSVFGTILTPGSEPSYSKVLGNLLFVSAPTTNQMLVINTTTNTITNTVNVNSPSGIAIYNGNGVLYIGDNSNNNINVISDSAFNVIETITNANSPLVLELANNFTTRKLYFSNQTSLSTNIGIICLPPPS